MPKKKTVIAIVDDDPDMLAALSELLQVLSFECLTFSSAEAFLESYGHHEFGCLITDVRMPGISGLELLEKLKKIRSPLPVIVISSSVNDETGAQAMANGALAFLKKPIDDKTLLHYLALALRQGDGV
ncbi:response regulator transcription factor [Ferrovibrio terrae]|nr:response regulator [Ferrovibrio terrae]